MPFPPDLQGCPQCGSSGSLKFLLPPSSPHRTDGGTSGLSAALLAGAHRRGINTAIETAGNVPWDFFYRVLEHVDTALHDHKLSLATRSKQWIGVDNTRIQANFKRAYETFTAKHFIARTPVIPGINDNEEHVRAVLAFIRPYKNVVDYELLPYHRYGESKYGFLGRVYALDDFPSLPAETLRRLQAIIDEAFGRRCPWRSHDDNVGVRSPSQ